MPLEARVELKRLTVQDLQQAKVKPTVIQKYNGKIKSRPRSKAQPSKVKATPYQVPAVPPLSMPIVERKEDDKPKLLNTYNNIKTQGDMIEAMIKAALPTLQGDKVSEIYNFLVDMGVENVEDLAFIEVDDMNKILKPVQSRKLIAAWKNKGVPNCGSNQTSVPEPVTFVPAVFQIQNMPDNKVYQVFHAPSSDNPQNTVVHSINIPGWQQKNTVQPSVQDVYPEYDSKPKSEEEPVKYEAPLASPAPKEWNPNTFKIPWHKVPRRIKSLLSRTKRLERTDQFRVIHAVANDIFRVSERPTPSEMETIGMKMLKKFPQALCDEKSKKSCKKLVGQLLNRMKFLRALKRGGKLDSVIPDYNVQTDSPKPSQPSKLEAILSSPLTPATSSKSSFSPEAFNTSVISKLSPSIEMSNKALTPAAHEIDLSSSSCASTSTSASNLNFQIPWHKMDQSLLDTLTKKQWLTKSQIHDLVEFVIDEYFLWNPKPKNVKEDAQIMAQQMCKIYPLSLTDEAFAVEGGNKYSSVALSRALASRAHLINMGILKANKPSTSKEISSLGNPCTSLCDTARPPFQNWFRSPLPGNKSALPTISAKDDFSIPWHKLDASVLYYLNGNTPLSYTDKGRLVRTVCTEYLKWGHKTSNLSEDTRRIAKHMCERYPLTLSNKAFGQEGGETESSYLAEVLRQAIECYKKLKVSTRHDFPVPWHKLDRLVLEYLDGRRRPLLYKEKEVLLKTVCSDYLQWEHRSANVSEDTRRIAKQMFEVYPSTLSNKAFGQEGGKTECSHLAELLRQTVDRFKRHERVTRSSKEVDVLDNCEEVANLCGSPILNHMLKNLPRSSCPSTSECSVPTTSTPDGFTIPWHELDKSLLNNLKREKKLSPAQKGSLVAMVSREYLLWENKTDFSEDTRRIAQHMCEVYPLSLSDCTFGNAWGNSDTEGSWFLAHLLWKRVDLITRQQSQYFKGLSFLDTSEMQSLCAPPAESDTSKKSTSSSCSPVRDCASPENSTRGEFAIPWHKLDKTLLDALNKNKQLTLAQSWDLVLPVCEEFLQWNPSSSNIDQYTRQIAEQMCEIYPSSLSNNALGSFDGDTPGSALACMLRSKVWDLRNDSKQKSQSSMSSDNSGMLQLQCTEELSEMASDPDSSCPDPVEDPSSPLIFDCGAFSIPWNKLDTSALNSLKMGKKLSKSSKINIIHVICNEFEMWHPDISAINIYETSRMLAKKLVKIYPKSLSSAAFGKPGAEDSSSILFSSFRSRFTLLRKNKSKLQVVAAGGTDQNSHDEGEGDSGVLDWAINFRIPWEKMPQELLNSLKNKERLSPSLRSELVRIISGDILKIEENPNKECVDYIASEMCTMYPKSLSDLSCVYPANKHDFLGREILWRIQRVNHANKSSDQDESKENKSVDSPGTSKLDDEEPVEILDAFPCPPSILEVELEVDSNPSSIPTNYPSIEDPNYQAGYDYDTAIPQPYLTDAEASSSANQHTDNSTPNSLENQDIEDPNCGIEAGIDPSTLVPDCSTKSPDNVVPGDNAKSDVSPDNVTTHCANKKVVYFAEVVKNSDERCAVYLNRPVNKSTNIVFLARGVKDSEDNSPVAKYPVKTYSRNTEERNISAKAATSSSNVASDCSMSASTVLQGLSKQFETHPSEVTSDYYTKSVTYQNNVVSGCNANPVTYQSSVVSDCSTTNSSLPSTESSIYYPSSPHTYPASMVPEYRLPVDAVIRPNPPMTDPNYSLSQSNMVQNCNTNQMAYPVHMNCSSDNTGTYQQEPGSSSPYNEGYNLGSQYFQHLDQMLKREESEQDLRMTQRLLGSYWK